MTHKVLVVDDSKLARMAVAKTLNALHSEWTLLEAANASDALARIKEDTPEFVLLDFNMPDKDGLTLAAEIGRLNPNIAVALISANQQIEVVQRAHAAGATFLAKPLTEKALSGFLDAALARPAS